MGACEDFLFKMIPMCDERTKEYMERSTLRANEDAAIADAIAILVMASSLDLFGKVKSTSKARGFLQLQLSVGIIHGGLCGTVSPVPPAGRRQVDQLP